MLSLLQDCFKNVSSLQKDFTVIVDSDETSVKSFCNDETFLKQSCSNNNLVSTPLLTKFINCQQPALMMLHSVISEGMAPNIMVTIHSVQTPMMLDSGAEVSVLPLTLFQSFSSFFY